MPTLQYLTRDEDLRELLLQPETYPNDHLFEVR